MAAARRAPGVALLLAVLLPLVATPSRAATPARAASTAAFQLHGDVYPTGYATSSPPGPLINVGLV
jgi:hypothetical protein